MKKRITLTLLTFLMTITVFSQGLFISEVADPSDSWDARFVEIYNATSSDIDLEAGNYYLVKQVNAGDWKNIKLTGTIEAGTAFVIAYGQDGFVSAYGFEADMYNGTAGGNGDDGFYLYEGGDYDTGVLIDAYGIPDDLGEGTWDYEDTHAVRKPGYDTPNPTWTSAEWTIAPPPVTTADMTPGEHDATLPEEPQISNVYTAPEYPTSSDEVTVYATVLDNSAVATATLYYSTSSPVSTSDASVEMTANDAGEYTALVPQQADGSTVYYIIVAVDDDGNETQSSEYSYTVKDPLELTIAEIQTPEDVTVSDESPYLDQYVSVTGIVYALLDFGYFVQDGDGEWNGIFINDYTNKPNVGDKVKVYGTVNEYYSLTRIESITYYEVESTGNETYAPTVVSTLDANDEKYEGILLKVSGKCVSEADNYGEWEVDDNSGSVKIDDKIFAYEPVLNADYEVTGAANYSYGARKILPRSIDDIVETLPEGPVITDVAITPEDPSSTDRVTVSANVTDDGSVASVTVYYSTATPVTTSDSSVAMSVDTDSTYVAEIPEQADGTIVYYFIVAVDDEGNVTESVEFNYQVVDPIALSLSQIQTPADISVSDASPYIDTKVSVSGIVYAVSSRGYYIQDAEGAWNGVYVYDRDNVPARGDEVKLVCVVSEYYNLTELSDVSSFEVVSSGNTPYAAAEISIADANLEDYEGVLVKVTGTCTSDPDQYGQWPISDGTDTILISSDIFEYTPVVDTEYDVTGADTYSYSARKIQPRDDDDVYERSSTAINEVDSRFALYPSPVTNVLNIESPVRISNVNIVDILGKVVKTYQVDAKTAQLNTAMLNKGIYIVELTADNGDVYVQKIIKK